eukprot:1187202-Prorocentrum_minimum.AAC.6
MGSGPRVGCRGSTIELGWSTTKPAFSVPKTLAVEQPERPEHVRKEAHAGSLPATGRIPTSGSVSHLSVLWKPPSGPLRPPSNPLWNPFGPPWLPRLGPAAWQRVAARGPPRGRAAQERSSKRSATARCRLLPATPDRLTRHQLRRRPPDPPRSAASAPTNPPSAAETPASRPCFASIASLPLPLSFPSRPASRRPWPCASCPRSPPLVARCRDRRAC